MAGSGDEAVKGARVALRDLLSKLHVLEVLPERSRMLAVDSDIPVHAVLTAVLAEQHPRAPLQRAGSGLPGAAGGGAAGASEEAGAQMRREGGGAADDAVPGMSWEMASPSLPSNVLAEVCEDSKSPGMINKAGETPAAPVEDEADEKQPVVRRGWTSPDDGWGMNVPMQDLEKMPMGMPLTVGEVADFLSHACQSTPGQAAPPTPKEGESPASADMLDWSLSQWRAHRLKIARDRGEVPPADTSAEAEDASAPVVVVEELAVGPVLVHRVPLAPPRPILCLDDPEASLLKAVELLLAYPELDALPVVSPARCTVVAHLTLSYCLAYMLVRLRGPEFFPFANYMVEADTDSGAQRVFDGATSTVPALGASEAWADRRAARVTQLPWVLRPSQPLRELLTFFTKTHHSGVPVVEDSGAVLGLLSRRDVLNFLDLTMQMARRRPEGSAADADSMNFDVATPIEAVLATLQRFRNQSADDGASAAQAASAAQSAGDKAGSSLHGASVIYEKELSLKSLVLRVLGAENRKVLFVKDSAGGAAPQLLRILSVGDIWQLLLGDSQDAPEQADTVAQDI